MLFFVKLAVSLSEISVDSVWPLYGPLAGGTRVTITGQFVNGHTVTAVYFGENKGYLDTNRLPCPLTLTILVITFTRITFLKIKYHSSLLRSM